MPRKAKELRALEVSRLGTLSAKEPSHQKPGLHAVGGVSGLYLQITTTEARTWIFRYAMEGRRRDMGLGGYPDTTLAQAHDKARAAKELIDRGVDPIAERDAARSSAAAERAKQITFKDAAEKYVRSQQAGWRNLKHRAQWSATLEQYAYPTLGTLHVSQIDVAHVIKTLEPIWHTTTETATRLRGRIEKVLDWATASGFRSGPNPARWRGHLDTMLAKPGKIARAMHHPALPVHDVGAFMMELRTREGIAARALEFTILTAARSGEVRGALWSEIDLNAKVWTVPASRMKASKEHRVPLSGRAVELLEQLPKVGGAGLVFPAPNRGTLSDMTLAAVIRRMNVVDERSRWIDPKSGKPVVPHGFRSAFRDWAAERTNYPREMGEMALAHTIGDKVEAAYRRGDLFEKRRRMMDEWAKFCSKVERKGQVIPIGPMADVGRHKLRLPAP